MVYSPDISSIFENFLHFVSAFTFFDIKDWKIVDQLTLLSDQEKELSSLVFLQILNCWKCLITLVTLRPPQNRLSVVVHLLLIHRLIHLPPHSQHLTPPVVCSSNRSSRYCLDFTKNKTLHITYRQALYPSGVCPQTLPLINLRLICAIWFFAWLLPEEVWGAPWVVSSYPVYRCSPLPNPSSQGQGWDGCWVLLTATKLMVLHKCYISATLVEDPHSSVLPRTPQHPLTATTQYPERCWKGDTKH